MSHMQLVQEHVGSGLTLRVHALTRVTRFSRTPDGELYNPDFQMLAKSFGIESALIEEPDDLAEHPLN